MSLVKNSCAAAAAMFLLAGCGAGDDGGLSGAKANFAAEVEPICAETRQKVGQLGDDPVADRDAVQSAVDRFEALNPPGEDETTFRLFRLHLQNMALALEDLNQSRIVNNPERANTALQRAGESHDLAKEQARGYGFTECSQGLAT
jgi:hypothetical protein